MIETLLSLGLFILFCLVAFAANADSEAMIWAGVALAAVGFGYGIPTAIVYHWRLWASLRRAGRLPERWWLSPTSHHGLLPSDERRGVLVWGAIGGTGFLVIVLGIVFTAVGLWRTLVV